MLQGKQIAVVVPAFNEKRHIGLCLSSMPSYVDLIIVVDDASTDGTTDEVLQSSDARLELIRHDRNQGVGAAIMTGYRIASQRGMDIAAVLAGDGQMDPEDLPGILLPLLRGEADYVKGNRLVWPEARQIIPLSRWCGIKALEVLTRVSTGMADLHDCQCGYTALCLSFLSRIDVAAVYPRYGFPNDFLNHVAVAGGRIAERVVRPIYNGQRSDLKIHRVTFPIFFLIARGTWRRLRRSSPSKPMTDRGFNGRVANWGRSNTAAS